MEYNRKVQQLLGGGEGKPELTMAFGTVTVSEGSGADQKVRQEGEGGRTGGCWLWACLGRQWLHASFAQRCHSSPCLAPLLQVNNVAELLLVRGLAQVIRHRGDDERSGGCSTVQQGGGGGGGGQQSVGAGKADAAAGGEVAAPAVRLACLPIRPVECQ